MKEMYYNRKIKTELENLILKDYSWLIKDVKEHEELDFQVGSNKNKTWFSVYRGTGRILSIYSNGTVDAADAYKKVFPDFYENPNKKNFDILLEKINKDSSFGRYYINGKGEKKEGYYQNIISKRYSLFCKPEDELLIIDKECVLGYIDKKAKDKRLKPIRKKYDKLIENIKKSHPKWSQSFKQTGEEFDFIALTKEGDIFVLELKRSEDSTKTYLSPLQAGKYEEITEMFINDFYDDFDTAIHEMIEQKVRMKIMSPAWKIPEKLSGKVKSAVIVGGDSSKVKDRFKEVRTIVDKNIPYYECEPDGTLKYVM